MRGPTAEVIDTAPLTLDEIVAHMTEPLSAARMSPGFIPAIPRSMAPSPSRCAASMRSASIMTWFPGVPAYAAAAALLKTELTLPEVSQTVILTRTPGKASPMPKGEDLKTLGASGATLAIHLSVRNIHHRRATI